MEGFVYGLRCGFCLRWNVCFVSSLDDWFVV